MVAAKPSLLILRDSFPDNPEMGPALSKALLEEAAAGRLRQTVRLSRPGRVVAFGRRDAVSRGYRDAVAAARAGGYAAMERLSGGRAAAYMEGALSLTWTEPDPQPARRTGQRFERVAGLVRDALGDLGVDARVGEVEGEYCPGAYSVNGGGRIKLAGIGQRMIRGAAHVGVVLVVTGSGEVRRILEPVYSALELEWRPETVGSVEDERPGATLEDVEGAILARLEGGFDLEPVTLPPNVLDRAEYLAPEHRSPAI